MSKYIKVISLLFMICLIFNINYSCFASNEEANIDTSIISENFIKDLNPDEVSGAAESLSTPFVNLIQTVVNSILGFIQVIGGILMVVSVAMFGFGMVLSGNGNLAGELGIKINGESKGGADARFELLSYGRRLLIGSILLFSSATLVKFVFNILQV